MNPLKTTQRIVIYLLLLNIVLIGANWFISSKVNNNNIEISNLADELNQQLIKEKQLDSFKKIAEDTTAERGKLDSYFISPNGIVSFIKEIENLAFVAGVSIGINSVEVEEYLIKKRSSNTLELLDLELNFTGSWNNSFYFISLLEEMPYKIFIYKLDVDAQKDDQENTTGWKGLIGMKVLKIK
jgi:hypothetical protein